MIKISEILEGAKILEVRSSKINGELKVIKSLGWGTYIKGGGLTQSGGIAKDIWKKPLKKISNFQLPISNVLILGLGGGKIVELIEKHWPKAKITGVDIDPTIVDLGKKHLGLSDQRVNIVIEDAYEYLNKISKFKNKNHKSKFKYDLILTDLYVGDDFPKKFESVKYIHLVRATLSRSGIAVFNRLYYNEKKPLAQKFLKKLEKNFESVDVIYPEANVMFVCRITPHLLYQ